MKSNAQFVPDLLGEKYFRMAAIKVEPDKMMELQEKLRYFQIDGKPVRALKYDPDFQAANREKLKENTVFVKSLPKDLTSKELHDKLEE